MLAHLRCSLRRNYTQLRELIVRFSRRGKRERDGLHVESKLTRKVFGAVMHAVSGARTSFQLKVTCFLSWLRPSFRHGRPSLVGRSIAQLPSLGGNWVEQTFNFSPRSDVTNRRAIQSRSQCRRIL